MNTPKFCAKSGSGSTRPHSPGTFAARHAVAGFTALCLLCNVGTAAAQTPPAPPAPAPDDVRRAIHFLENATFGPIASDVSAIIARGADQWITEQFQIPESAIPEGLDTSQLRSRLYLNMAIAPDQLRQRMMFALSQTIVVSANKNGDGQELTPWVRLLGRNAFGNYRTLLNDVTLSPTMGKFLDLAYSKKASSTSSPNENYARELLQLFTIGLWEMHMDGSLKRDGQNQPIPTYTQQTIREFARAMTGWTFPTQPGSTPASSNPPYFVGQMEPRTTTHDTGSKTLLNGVTLPAGQTTAADMQAALDNIYQHTNVPPFVAIRLIRSLVTSNPSPAYIERVANVFANNGQGERGDLRAVLRAVLTDEEAMRFTSPEAGRLKDPVLHIIGLGRALTARIADPNAFMYVFSNLSQRVLTPPTVFSFYSPLATLPGNPDLFAPEFQIYPPALAIQRANFIYGILAGWFSSSFIVDLTPFTSVAGNVANLVTKVDHTVLFGRMSSQLRQLLVTATTAVPATSTRERALGALYLTALSSEFAVSADSDGAGIATLVLPPPSPPQGVTLPGGGGSGGGSGGGGGGGGGGSGMSGGSSPPPEPPPPPPPAPAPPAVSTTTPINLTGIANGFDLMLSWQNPVGAGTPSTVLLDVTGPIVTSVPLGVTQSFSYSGVPPGSYTFTVRAVTAQGASGPSNAVTLSFPGSGGPASASCSSSPQAPTGVSATQSGSLVTLTWQPGAGQATASYVVNVTGSYVGSFSTAVPVLSGSVGAGVYIVTVQAMNACGASLATAPFTINVP